MSKTANVFCPFCGAPEGSDHRDRCPMVGILQQNNPVPTTGWICPVCGRGNAPHVSICPCLPYPKYEVTC